MFLTALLPLQLLRRHSAPQPQATAAVQRAAQPTSSAQSDEALLEDVNSEISRSVPASMQALADPSDDETAVNSETSVPTSNQRNEPTMTPRMTLSPLFALAAFALCGTIALAQQTRSEQGLSQRRRQPLRHRPLRLRRPHPSNGNRPGAGWAKECTRGCGLGWAKGCGLGCVPA